MAHGCLSSLRVRLILLVLIAVVPALGLILYTASDQRRPATTQRSRNAQRLEAGVGESGQAMRAPGNSSSRFTDGLREDDSAACSALFADF